MARNETKAEKALFVKQGAFIRELRARASVTMVDLANKVDRAPLTISLIEKGEYGMSMLLKERILAVLRPAIPPHLKFNTLKEFGSEHESSFFETNEIAELKSKIVELEKTIIKIAGGN